MHGSGALALDSATSRPRPSCRNAPRRVRSSAPAGQDARTAPKVDIEERISVLSADDASPARLLCDDIPGQSGGLQERSSALARPYRRRAWGLEMPSGRSTSRTPTSAFSGVACRWTGRTAHLRQPRDVDSTPAASRICHSPEPCAAKKVVHRPIQLGERGLHSPRCHAMMQTFARSGMSAALVLMVRGVTSLEVLNVPG